MEIENIKLLLVEDEVVIAMHEKHQLESLGYSVDHASNGAGAVKQALGNAASYDLILMDIDLGQGMDGTEAAARILEERDIPVMFLSSHTEPHIVEKTEKITSYGYVVKNTGVVVLNASIQMALKLFREKQERQRAETLVSEQKWLYEQILEQSMAGYWDWKIKENTEYLSPTFKRMFGYEEHEMENTPEAWQKIIFAEDLPQVKEVLEKHFATRGQYPYYNEVRYRHRNGSVVWVICTGKVIEWDKDGAPLRMVGCHIDITKLKQTEESLRSSEERFASLFEKAPLGYQSLDANGVFIEINQAWVDMLGYKKEEVVGKWFGDFLAPEYVDAFRERFPLFKQRGTIHSEFYMKHKDGSLRYIAFDGRISHDIDGSFKQTHCILKDDTERKRMDEVIKRQLVEKEILLKEAHHRIKNNIASIEAFLGLQAVSADIPEVGGILQDAVSRVQSMRVFYERLLLDDSFRDVPVRQYVEDLVASLRMVFPESARVAIEFAISDFSLPAKHASSLGIIVNELLTNVFKHSFAGGKEGQALIKLEKDENGVTLMVSDDGMDFGNAGQPGQLGQAKGFGLSIIKMLTEQFGGTYTVQNDNGTKSVVRLKM